MIMVKNNRYRLFLNGFLLFAGVFGGAYAQQAANLQQIGPTDKAATHAKLKATATEAGSGKEIYPMTPYDISPLLIGEKIEEASLKDADGRSVELAKVFDNKPTVLVMYRGGWCPYCSKQLSSLQELEPELIALGYQLVAVSTDAPEQLRTTLEKKELKYTLLSDADLSFARSLGIAYKAPKEYLQLLPTSTGGMDKDLLLPVPAVYIVDKTGCIQFEYINPDFRRRLNGDLLKAAALSLKPFL